MHHRSLTADPLPEVVCIFDGLEGQRNLTTGRRGSEGFLEEHMCVCHEHTAHARAKCQYKFTLLSRRTRLDNVKGTNSQLSVVSP